MRSRVLAGIDPNRTGHGDDIDVYKGYALASRGRVGAIGAAVAAVIQWLSTHAAQLGPIVQHLFHFGPGYDPANGGEIARQLGPISEGGTGTLDTPAGQAYTDWVKKYDQPRWQGTVSIWAPGAGNNSTWNDVYRELVAAGMPNGSLVDANMVPVGMPQVQAAVTAHNNVQAGPNAPTVAQLAQMNAWAMDIVGLRGPVYAANARAAVAQLRKPWADFVNAMVNAWTAANVLDGGSGGTWTGGGTGGGTDTGGGGADPDEPKKNGTTTVVLAALAAKLLGLF